MQEYEIIVFEKIGEEYYEVRKLYKQISSERYEQFIRIKEETK